MKKDNVKKEERIINYALNHIKIKSSWFDKWTDSNRVFIQLGFKGLYLYFTLYRFYVRGQDNHTFFTSIGMLKKHMENHIEGNRSGVRYSCEEILELLKTMEKAKVIRVNNKTRWDQLLKDDKKVDENRLLDISAIDTPQTTRDEDNDKDVPDSKKDYYIPVDLRLMDYYLTKEIGLTERYFPLYCLIRKMSNGYDEQSWMTIETMSEYLGMDKDSINSMIHKLNRKYLLLSLKRARASKGKGHRFEHHICNNLSKVDKFKRENEVEINKNIKSWDKTIVRKNKSDNKVESKSETIDFDDLEQDDSVECSETKSKGVGLQNRKKKAASSSVWGEPDTFKPVWDDSNNEVVSYPKSKLTEWLKNKSKKIDENDNPFKEDETVYVSINN